MVQALKIVNLSPQLRKKILHKNGQNFPKFRFRRNPVSLKVSDPLKKATPYPSTTHCATNPNNVLLLLQAMEKEKLK